MSRHYKAICIGGPYDGRWFSAKRDFFNVVEMPKIDCMSKEVSRNDTVSRMTYIYITFHGFHIWVPERQSMEETAKLLITGYRPDAGATPYER